MLNKDKELLVDMSYNFFDSKPPNHKTLNEFVERMSAGFPDYNVDKEELFKILETKHLITISEEIRVIKDSRDHLEWFNDITSTIEGRDLDWGFWKDFKRHLRNKKK